MAEYVELTAPAIASADVVSELSDETEGNPLFVGEIVRLLSVEGVRSEGLAIPQTVRDVIARRLTHLSDECNRVLALASVLGREFPLDALARLAGVSADEMLDVLDEAMTARVLSDVAGAPDRLRFAHVLIRDTLYEGLTTARRVRLHHQAADALETLHGEDPGRIPPSSPATACPDATSAGDSAMRGTPATGPWLRWPTKRPLVSTRSP